MRDYKGWTAKERRASLRKTKAAISEGVIPPPTKCNRCGKESGRIDYHNHNYSDPIKYLEPLCQGCHMRLHRLENQKKERSFADDTTSNAAPEVPKPDRKSNNKPLEKVQSVNVEFSDWLEKGMKLPLPDLVEHIRSTPAGVKPLKALRGLGIVFCNGFTKDYSCPGYPQTAGIGKDRARFDVVLERIKFHERNGESLKIKGEDLSAKLESNYANNKP